MKIKKKGKQKEEKKWTLHVDDPLIRKSTTERRERKKRKRIAVDLYLRETQTTKTPCPARLTHFRGNKLLPSMHTDFMHFFSPLGAKPVYRFIRANVPIRSVLQFQGYRRLPSPLAFLFFLVSISYCFPVRKYAPPRVQDIALGNKSLVGAFTFACA